MAYLSGNRSVAACHPLGKLEPSWSHGLDSYGKLADSYNASPSGRRIYLRRTYGPVRRADLRIRPSLLIPDSVDAGVHNSRMGGPTHDAEALAAFQSGEERLVYARYKDRPVAPSSYYLVDGTARDRELKAWVKEHLECLMPECPDRRLVAVNRSEHSGRRDGFSHHRGAGQHGLEGLFHQQAKALIQSWVTDRFPHVQAVPSRRPRMGRAEPT